MYAARVLSGWLMATSLAGVWVSASAAELVWNDNAGIYRTTTCVSEPQKIKLYDSFDTKGIAVDAIGNHLVWSDILPLGSPLPGGAIRTGGFFGGEITDAVNELPSPAGVAVDAAHGKIFWTDLGDAQHHS